MAREPRPGQRTVAIVAAHDEADAIAATLDALSESLPGVELVVADDASTDGTPEIAERHGARVVRGQRSRGKGGNVTAAAESVLAEGYADLVLLCDADLGASARELAPLPDAIEQGACDLAIAAFARREGGGFGIAVGFARRAIERLCGFRARAPISGQRAMRAEVLRDVLPFADGFGLELGMTVDAVRAGYRVNEIELPLEHRTTRRDLRGFLHRGRQLRDFVRAERARRPPG